MSNKRFDEETKARAVRLVREHAGDYDTEWAAMRDALAETTIGLYKTECVREGSPFRTGPLRRLADLEEITSTWVHWYNTSRLMHRLGRRPPAEAEAEYYAHLRVGQHTDHT